MDPSIFDINEEKMTAKVRLFRGAASDAVSSDSMSWWTTDKSVAETYAEKIPNKAGALHERVFELPIKSVETMSTGNKGVVFDVNHHYVEHADHVKSRMPSPIDTEKNEAKIFGIGQYNSGHEWMSSKAVPEGEYMGGKYGEFRNFVMGNDFANQHMVGGSPIVSNPKFKSPSVLGETRTRLEPKEFVASVEDSIYEYFDNGHKMEESKFSRHVDDTFRGKMNMDLAWDLYTPDEKNFMQNELEAIKAKGTGAYMPAPRTTSAALNSPVATDASNASINVSQGKAASTKPPELPSTPVQQAVHNPTTPTTVPGHAANAAKNTSQGMPATVEHPSQPAPVKRKKKAEEKRSNQRETGSDAAKATSQGTTSSAKPIDPPTNHPTVPTPPAPEGTPQAGGKLQTVGTELKDAYKGFAAKPFKHRAAVTGIAGAALGILTSDHKDDSAIRTIMDGAMGAGTAIAVDSATNYIIKNHGDKISEFMGKQAGASVGDVAKVANEIDVDKMISKMKVGVGRAGWVTAGIGAFIGGTAILGVSNKLERNRKTQRMQNDAERAMVKKEHQEQQRMSELFGYNKHQPMGQLVMDMWDDRMGHHKMGNAKFK